MNFKTTVVLLILFLAIGAYLLFTSGEKQDDQSVRARDEKVLDVPAADVKRISVAAATGERLMLERSDGGWRLLQPVQAKAAEYQANQLVSAVVDLKREGRVDREEAELARTVTEKPAYTVEITTKDDKTHKLTVGQKSTIGNVTYVQLDGKGRIYVVSGTLHDQLAKAADEYREMRLVDVPSDKLQRIEIEAEERQVALARQDGAWQIAAPTTRPVDESAVSSLVSTLTGLRAGKFVDPAQADPLRTGLDRPRLTIRFTGEGEPAATQTLKIGSHTDLLKKDLYAQVGDGPVATISSWTFDSLNKGPLDLRSKEVLRVEPAKVTSLTLVYDLPATTQPTTRPARKGEVRLKRVVADTTLGPPEPATAPATAPSTAPTTAETTEPATQPTPTWTVEGSERQVNDDEVDRLLRQLDPLRATKFVTEAPQEVIGRYTLNLTAGEGNAFRVELIKPASGEPVGKYQDMLFEVSSSLMDAINALMPAE